MLTKPQPSSAAYHSVTSKQPTRRSRHGCPVSSMRKTRTRRRAVSTRMTRRAPSKGREDDWLPLQMRQRRQLLLEISTTQSTISGGRRRCRKGLRPQLYPQLRQGTTWQGLAVHLPPRLSHSPLVCTSPPIHSAAWAHQLVTPRSIKRKKEARSAAALIHDSSSTVTSDSRS